jgi:hypothetical protein
MYRTIQKQLVRFRNQKTLIPDLMKIYCVGFLFMILSFQGFSQLSGDHKVALVFNKLVLDVGATPVSWSDVSMYDFYFYNFAIGYQFGKRFDLRLHRDLVHVVTTWDNSWDYYNLERLRSLGVGVNYRVQPEKWQGIMKGVSYSLALKAGFTISKEYKEQQSIFYDISARIYPLKYCYFATGFNHDLFSDQRIFHQNKQHIQTFYFSFGLDF